MDTAPSGSGRRGWKCREGEGRHLAEHTEQASFSLFSSQGVTLGQDGDEQEGWLLLLDRKFIVSPDALLGFLARAGDRETCPAPLCLRQWRDLRAHWPTPGSENRNCSGVEVGGEKGRDQPQGT